MPDTSAPKWIFVLSDGTGSTGSNVVRACLKQFDGVPVQLRIIPSVTDNDQLRRAFQRAAELNALVVTTLVRGEQRREVERLAITHRLQVVDLVGNMLMNLTEYLRTSPRGQPGLMHRPDRNYFRRVSAIEFTVKADDGQEPRLLTDADIVLVGVSRTSKTPLSVFLAYKGYKVGNVPLVLDREPPESLWDCDPRRVFGLTIDPSALQSIRAQRIEQMRLSDKTNYCQNDYILAELDFAHDLFARNREWPVIDVTDKALEETAAIILKILSERGLAEVIGEAGQL